MSDRHAVHKDRNVVAGRTGVAKVQALLMPRAESVHGFVKRRIPVGLASDIAPDDVLQEVWMTVFDSDHLGEVVRLGATGDLDTWLLTVAKRKLVDAINRARCNIRRGGKTIHSQSDLLSHVAAQQRTPPSEVAALEAASPIQNALSSLPANYREVITLYHLEGLPQGDVATIMQRSRPAVRGLLRRGMRPLRQQMGASSQFFDSQYKTIPFPVPETTADLQEVLWDNDGDVRSAALKILSVSAVPKEFQSDFIADIKHLIESLERAGVERSEIARRVWFETFDDSDDFGLGSSCCERLRIPAS